MNLSDAQEYCQKKALHSGSSFYYSFFFLDNNPRLAITALYAFCRTVDDVVDESSNPHVAAAQLRWWRSEIENLFSGQPQHPISLALAPWLQPCSWKKETFLDIITGVEMDLMPTFYPDIPALQGYTAKVAGAVGILTSALFHALSASETRPDALEHFSLSLGHALQYINIIRDIQVDALKERLYLPTQWLQAQDIEPGLFIHNPALFKEKLCSQLLPEMATQARHHIHQALHILAPESFETHQSAWIMTALYSRLLDKMEKDGFAVLTQRYYLHPLEKCWIAWRVYRLCSDKNKDRIRGRLMHYFKHQGFLRKFSSAE